ncbi:MAG: hypothetical protein Q4F72_08160 [Desulfovibrionaceae bacterium]|nr:hypothetical protein [Desulfovibrionaceae bacterium]
MTEKTLPAAGSVTTEQDSIPAAPSFGLSGSNPLCGLSGRSAPADADLRAFAARSALQAEEKETERDAEKLLS